MGPRLAWAVAGMAFALLVTGATFTLIDLENIPRDQVFGDLGFAPTIVAFGVVGALIGTRQPRNRVGWLCLAISLLFALVVSADAVSTWGWLTGSLPRALCQWISLLTLLWV